MANKNDYNWTDPATGKATAPGVGNPTLKASPPAPTTKPNEAVAINGAEFNTSEKQKENFTDIQPQGNTLYGVPKAPTSPVLPDVISQSDFDTSMSAEKLSEVTNQAKSLTNFTPEQTKSLDTLNAKIETGYEPTQTDINNLDYAKTKGYVYNPSTEPKVESATGTPEANKSTVDQIFESKSNLATVRATAKLEASKALGLDEKSTAIATAQSVVNQLRTELQNQGIMDIKEQDVIRGKPILTAQIAGQLSELSREQKLDAMILQNNYNNALVESQIAQGNYDRAYEIVKETASDAYQGAKDQVDALLFKGEIEQKAADKLTTQLEDERDLALNGYVLIKSAEGLKGLTEDQIYRDPVNGNIYLKPKPTVASTMEIGGITYGFDNEGNKIATYGKTETPSDSETTVGISKAYISAIETGLVSRVGSDGYLSPEDYNGAKQEWINAKGTPASFDKKFKDRRNPTNKYYNVEGAKSTNDTDFDLEGYLNQPVSTTKEKKNLIQKLFNL
jgi:hypothetical protein